MKFTIAMFVFLCGALWGILFGWAVAHSTVGIECAKLGGFYVGDRVFTCEERTK